MSAQTVIIGSLPTALQMSLSGETPEFAVKAARAYAPRAGLFFLFFSAFWVSVTGVVGVVFSIPMMLGKSMKIAVNGVPTMAGPGHYGVLLAPAIIMILFSIIGIGMLVAGLYMLFAPGGWFVGTRSRLICFRRSMTSIDWEQFNGMTDVRGDDTKGTLFLQLRTGRYVNRRNGGGYVPDVVAMTGIANVSAVERICRARIKENDPTPVSAPSS